jgi:hypothetical protein
MCPYTILQDPLTNPYTIQNLLQGDRERSTDAAPASAPQK